MRKYVFTSVLIGFLALQPRFCSAFTTNIQAGQTLTGLLAAGTTNFYNFFACSNDTITVLAVHAGDDSLLIDSQVKAPSSDSCCGRPEGFGSDIVYFADSIRITETGTNQLLIKEFSDSGEFQYSVTMVNHAGLNVTDADGSGGEIHPGETITGRLGGPADIDIYTFAASSNDTVTVLAARTAATDEFTINLRLITPGGIELPVAVHLGGFNAVEFINAVKLPESGVYQLLIMDEDGPGTATFDYDLSLMKVPGPNMPFGDGGIILSGQAKHGTIDVGDLDTFEFYAAACQSVNIALTNSDDCFTAVLELYAPNGDLLKRITGFSPFLIQISQLGQSGTFTLLYRAETGLDQFSYDVSLSLVSPPAPILAPDGRPLLAISFCTDIVLLRWLTNAMDYRLESTTNLPPFANWLPVTTVPVISGNEFSVAERPMGSRKFFRLRKD